MRLLVDGPGNYVAEFIEKRLFFLEKQGIQLQIILRYGERQVPAINQATYIRLFSFRKAGLRKSLVYLLKKAPALLSSLVFCFQIYKYYPYRNVFKGIAWVIERHEFKRIRPDLIHIQWVGNAISFSWLKNYFGVPMISSVRGSQITVYPITRQGYKEHLNECLQISDYLHAVSNDMRKELLKWKVDEQRIFVNYNGIDIEKFCPVKRKSHDRVVRLITVGTLMWRKNYWSQLHIFKDLIEDKPSLRLDIFGLGQDYEGLSYLIYKLQLKNHVFLHGYVDENKVIKALQESDIYLSTSVAEGLSNSVMEAASCGLPVVAFDCEGMQEIIKDGKTGFIVPFGDLDTFRSKLNLLIEDSNLRAIMGNEARQHVEKNFNVKDTISSVVQQYYKIIEKNIQ